MRNVADEIFSRCGVLDRARPAAVCPHVLRLSHPHGQDIRGQSLSSQSQGVERIQQSVNRSLLQHGRVGVTLSHCHTVPVSFNLPLQFN